MNILVTGANGQLGKCIRKVVERSDFKNKYTFVGHEDLDITDKDAVMEYITDNEVDIVINCAANTNVDGCEDATPEKTAVNISAPSYLAKALKTRNGFLIHISTDFVYAPYLGWDGGPFKEEDAGKTPQLNHYGATKYAGEYLVKNSGCDYVILRTSWLYSQYGNNFFTKIRKLPDFTIQKVVCDQVGTPTSAMDLATFICLELCEKPEKREEVKGEVFNFSGVGACSKYDFATAILRDRKNVTVSPCYSSEFKTPAERPKYSVMDLSKIILAFPDCPVFQQWEDILAYVKQSLEYAEYGE